MRKFLVFLIAVLSLHAFAGDGVKTSGKSASTYSFEEKMSDLDQLVSLIKSGYGPLYYKKDKMRIDVESLRSQYAEELAKTETNGGFYYTLLRFLAEFHDGHLRANIPTDLKAMLPFETDLIEGKVLVTKINSEDMPETGFQFKDGDEIVALDGKPISEVVDELQKYRGSGNPATERRIAAMAVAVRNGKRVPVPEGDVTLQVRRGNAKKLNSVKLTWKVEGTPIDEKLQKEAAINLLSFKKRSVADFDDISIQSEMNDLRHPYSERWYSCSGETRIEIPKDATMIMDKPFVAYYHPTAKGNIGYLRIPHYSPEDENYDLAFSQYEYAVSELEKNTVGLIIDQDHNCGGSIRYMHQLVSLFAREPYKGMQFRLRANKSTYLKYQEWIKSPEALHTLDQKRAENVLKMIETAWMKGDFLTEMTAIDGKEMWHPNSVRYTKPIIVLIDEMSGSCGDAFPAMIQGIGRAKLLGARTAGLGGNVTTEPTLFNSQIVPDMTKSLFYRPDGTPIENNGAEPDIPYTPTRDDFLNKYRGYQKFYTEKLLEMIQ